GVSMQALIMRAQNLGIITDGQKRYLFRQLVAKHWIQREPVEIPPEKPRLLRKLAESIYGHSGSAELIAQRIDAPTPLLRPIIEAFASATEIRRNQSDPDAPQLPHREKVLKFKMREEH